jgi:threonine/homoserine/homoserine lactone efflux protein
MTHPGPPMTTVELTLAIAFLLITPGPTNTLLALAGAEGGMTRALGLIPAELAGYLSTVTPLALLGTTLLAQAPVMEPVITATAAAWVAWLAVGFWRRAMAAGNQPGGDSAAKPPAPASVSAWAVFVTTLLNPKALVFGLVLLPAGPSLAGAFAIFVGQIVIVAALWGFLGHLLRRADRAESGLPRWILQLAAAWLAVVAGLLVLRIVGA